jgi:ribosomal protein S21
MRKYNKSGKRNFEEYDQKLDKKRKKYGKKINALDGIEPYQVEVRNGDVMKAYRVLERMLKKDRILETYREKQYYRKPSEIRSEEKRRKKRTLEKERIRRQLEEALDDS